MRFFLGQDSSGHWYVVPQDHRDDWDGWCALDEDDEAAWEAPAWAKPIGGSPSMITFCDPQEDQ